MSQGATRRSLFFWDSLRNRQPRFMATQTMVPVTICPPAPQTEFFDRCLFDNKCRRVVTSDNGISFSDYGQMHVIRTPQFSFRTKYIPPFAHNDKQLARVLTVLGWQYVHGGCHGKPVPENLTVAQLF